MRQGGHRRDQLLAQGDGGFLADRNNDRQRHATLSRRTESGAGEVVHHLVQIGVRHDDAVVLGAAHGLHPLPGRDAAR